MSIPTIFHNSNCLMPKDYRGPGMLQFCSTFHPNKRPSTDYCEIFTQDDYNTYQLGCINHRYGSFVDNNNNTVDMERTANMGATYLDVAFEFPIGSHNNYIYVPFVYSKPSTTETPTSTEMTRHRQCFGYDDSTGGTSFACSEVWIPVTPTQDPWTFDPATYTGTPAPSWSDYSILEGTEDLSAVSDSDLVESDLDESDLDESDLDEVESAYSATSGYGEPEGAWTSSYF